MDSYIVISIYREPSLLLLAPSRLSPTKAAAFMLGMVEIPAKAGASAPY
jgi:hypothetical protein